MGKHGAVVKTKLKASGFARLRSGAPVIAELERRAKLIQDTATANAESAGYDRLPSRDRQGMEVDSGISGKGNKRRARASVRTGTYEAMKAEATDRALTKAIQAGRA